MTNSKPYDWATDETPDTEAPQSAWNLFVQVPDPVYKARRKPWFPTLPSLKVA